MSENYKKLSKEELREVYNQLAGYFSKAQESETYREFRAFIKKYYPDTAAYAVVTFDSEYNDQTYDNSVQYVAVYDKSNKEILPLSATAKECRSSWRAMELENNNGEGTFEPASDITVFIATPSLPTLYIKE